MDIARTAAAPCACKDGYASRLASERCKVKRFCIFQTLARYAFEKTKRNTLRKEEERRFGENLRPDVREEEFCSPADNEGEESAGNSVVGFLKSTFLVDVCIMTHPFLNVNTKFQKK